MALERVTFNASDPFYSRCKELSDAMLIPDPWNIPALRKNGLYSMYIIDAFMRCFRISAESDASRKLITPNPLYKKVLGILEELIDDGSMETFGRLLEAVSFSIDKVKHWDGLIPDIRVLERPEDCLSWLYSKLIK